MKALPRILIADDAPDQLDILAIALEGIAGVSQPVPMARVVKAHDGAAALQEYEKAKTEGDPFELIILDLAMPIMNGFTTAQKIRESGDVLTRIVYSTMYDKDEENDSRAKETLALGVWYKMLPMKEFRAKVAAVLDGRTRQFEPEEVVKPVEIEQTVAMLKTVQRTNRWRVNLILVVASVLLAGNLGMSVFSLYRAPRVYSAISSIDTKIDDLGKIEPKPKGYPARLAKPRDSIKHMANGNTRYTFEFEKGSVPKVEAGKAYRIQITPERK